MAKQHQPKQIVNARIAAETLTDLERVRLAMRPLPTRSQLIELAVHEFVERRKIVLR